MLYSGNFMEISIPRRLRQLPDWPSLSPFSMAVLAAVYSIPKGETSTYKQVAKMAARLAGWPRYARACRAVGSVMRKNPYAPLVPYAESLRSSSNGPLVSAPSVPCHRVIKSDGSLGNYSGRGGIRAKRRLLEKEKIK